MLTAADLGKRFGGVVARDGRSLAVARGRIYVNALLRTGARVPLRSALKGAGT